MAQSGPDPRSTAVATAETLVAASLALAQSRDLDSILATLLDHLRPLVPYDSASVLLLDGESRLVVRAVRGFERWGSSSAAQSAVFDPRVNVHLMTVLQGQEPVRIDDTLTAPGWQRVAGAEHVRSWIGVPLLVRGRAIGLYSLDKAEPGFFDDVHVRIAQALAPMAATAIEIARVLSELREAADLSGRQNRILEGIATNAALEDTLTTLARLVESSCPGTLCTILLLDEDGRHVRHGAAPSFPAAFVAAVDGQMIGPAAGSCGTAMFRREPVVVTDILVDPLWAQYRGLASLAPVRACWSTPVFSHDARVLGSFAVYFREPRGPQDTERRLVDVGTSLAAIAIERWRGEKTLRRGAARLEAILDGALDAVISMDALGRVTSWNPRAHAIFGWKAEEALGRTVAELIVPEGQRDAHRRGISRLVQTGESALIGRRIALTAIRRNGSEFPIELSLVAVEDDQGPAFTAFIADITERKEAERLLSESERRLSDMLANLHLAALMLDAEGRITYCNDHLLEITGWSRAYLIGQNWFDAFSPTAAEDPRILFEKLLRDDPEAWHYETEILTKAGTRRTIRWNNSVLRSAAGAVTGAAHIGEDITDRKDVEEQLRQAQKMDAVGRLAGGIAHDFNNLLAVIIGYGQMLARNVPDAHPDHRRVEQILRAADRAAALTRQLLAFSRKQVMALRVLEPSTVVADMQAMLTRLIGEDIAFALDARARGRVKADPGQLEQVVMNLVVNARDAMPTGGALKIATADVDLDAAMAPGPDTVQAGRYVMISVADTGQGMDEATQARIFEPFFTTKSEGRGTGLGLATVYGIVKQSGGHIWHQSVVGQGTVFRVYLPRVEEEALSVAERSREGAQRRASETILVVEDEPAGLELIAEILRGEGYTVLPAASGEEALEVAARTSVPIHLLLTDVVLPHLSGPHLADRVRALQPQIKVVFMSGYTDDRLSRHGVLEPGIVLLQKPFTPDDLTRQLGVVLDS